jgi:hypothetical protein
MIQFRCWYCNRRYAVPEKRTGERLTCSCERLVRVPKRSGGNCRVKTLVDWLIEAVLYGGGGALLGFGLALLLVSQAFGLCPLEFAGVLVAVLTLAGFLLGLLGGERGINWVGRMIRGIEGS